MKRIFFCFSLALYCLLYVGQSLCDPLLVVVLMVKNEAQVMAPTLQPFADAGIDSYFIFDTGSTDDTIAVTEQFFKDHGIKQGVIEQEPFIDFASSRNRALRRAEANFPEAVFMLMLDAEWHLKNGSELLKFCAEHRMDNQDSYLINVVAPNLDFCTQRLMRAHRGVKFVGVVHEVLDRVSYLRVPKNVFFELHTTQYGREKSERRWLRDRDLLLKEHERNPLDSRTAFYLAQTYDCLGDWENARIYYTKRCAMPGWDEENFMAYYRLAQVYENLKQWDKALHYYMEAYSMRPGRVEPLVRVANYYLASQKFDLSFLFARHAAEIAYPENDTLFIDKYLYDFMRHDILGQCAWYVGKYPVGEAAVRKALTVQPDAPHLRGNLALYLKKRSELKALQAQENLDLDISKHA